MTIHETQRPAAALIPEVALRPVREGQAFEATVEQLAAAIRLGIFPVGSQLPPERELAARLGVSRVTLRECLDVLRNLGMVDTRRGRAGGNFASGAWADAPAESDSDLLRGADLEDLLAFRRVVEGGAAYMAAARPLPSTDRSYLRQCVTDVVDVAQEIPFPVARHRQRDAQLHLAIAASSGSGTLLQAVTKTHVHLDLLLSAIPVLERNIDHSNSDHAAIVDAILSGEPDDARDIAEEHCDKTAALLRGLVG